MRQYVSKNEWDKIPGYVKEHIIQVSGFSLLNQDQIYKKFSIGLLLELINSHIEPDFHIIKLDFAGGTWKVTTFSYNTEDRELLVALFKAFLWCYDDKKRKSEQEKDESKWKDSSKQLVNKRFIR